MIKTGKTVAPFFDMGRRAIVLEVREAVNKTWMVGGCAGKSRLAKIQFEDTKEITELPLVELMLIDDEK